MENAIEIISTRADFPALLREIPDPPKKLWVRGNIERALTGASKESNRNKEEPKFLCVVGSRKASDYGTLACEHILEGLRGHNIVVISGLALGIDSVAHRKALDVGLRTIAIPGSGLNWDILYPQTHVGLAHSIIEAGGALISIFPPHFTARSYGFPERNRIMAGMAHAVLVIEAEEKSGTLITARLATDYNRDVGVVPGSIFSRGTAGPHMLMRVGATPIHSSADVLDLLGIETTPAIAADGADGAKDTKRAGEIFDAQHLAHSPFPDLSEHEKTILRALREPLSKDALVERTGFSIQEINVALSSLEIRKLIHSTGATITSVLR